LSEIGKDLNIVQNSLVSLDGLQNLTRVGGAVTIDVNEKLKTLHGLGQVEEIGTLELSGNPVLTSLSGLSGLSHLGGGGAVVPDRAFSLWENPVLTELGLSALRTVDGDIEIFGGALESLAGLDNLSTVGGRFMIDGALALKSLDGLDKLASADRISVSGCPKLVSLRALASLKSVANGCDFSQNQMLPTCEAQWLRSIVEALGDSFSSSGTNNQGVCP